MEMTYGSVRDSIVLNYECRHTRYSRHIYVVVCQYTCTSLYNHYMNLAVILQYQWYIFLWVLFNYPFFLQGSCFHVTGNLIIISSLWHRFIVTSFRCDIVSLWHRFIVTSFHCDIVSLWHRFVVTSFHCDIVSLRHTCICQ